MFTSIVCPVDFSAHSERALGYALKIGALTGAHVTIVHVVDAFLDAATEAARTRETLTGQTQDEIRQLLSRMAPEHNDERLGIAISVGDPAEEILKQVEECEADLVVMGTQGLEGARRFVFGSTTERVLRESKVPVLAVPAPPVVLED